MWCSLCKWGPRAPEANEYFIQFLSIKRSRRDPCSNLLIQETSEKQDTIMFIIPLRDLLIVPVPGEFCCGHLLHVYVPYNTTPESDGKTPGDDGKTPGEKDEAITYRAQKRATGSLLLEAGWWPGGNMIILLCRM